MPFEVFRRYQKSMLVVFAIMAMFGFVLADSLPRLFNSPDRSAGGNPILATLHGKAIRGSDLAEIRDGRAIANQFVGSAVGQQGFQPFGGYTTRELVDAYLLRREADRLAIPSDARYAREWLRQFSGGKMTRELFDFLMGQFADRYTGEQVLLAISGQARLDQARRLMTESLITPLDVFDAYRDQNERVAARVVAFPVESFLDTVGEPSPEALGAFYDTYKGQLPDPARDTPGFKVPRQVRVESLSADGAAIARDLKAKLTEEDLRAAYENKKAGFKVDDGFDLPNNEFFLGRPDLTPVRYRPFDEIRESLSGSLAEDRAQAEILRRFGEVEDQAMIPFVEKYQNALDARNEAATPAEKDAASIPAPDDLAPVAARLGLTHEVTPWLDRDEADRYGTISGASMGLNFDPGSKRFADQVFDSKPGADATQTLYEPFQMADFSGRRYLARKLADNAPKVPPLDKVKPEVILAWKAMQARPLAEKAAETAAAKARASGGKFDGDIVDGRPVLTLDPTSKLQQGMPDPRTFTSGPAQPSPIHEVPEAGDAFRDALYSLHPGDVKVAPNAPKSAFYALSFDRRDPASFAALYAPTGPNFLYQRDAMTDAQRRRDTVVMTRLRKDAGLTETWTPPDEAERLADASH